MTNSMPQLAPAHWQSLADEASRLVARRVAGDADLDDVVQEVMVRVWRHGDGLRDDERFRAWLASIVRNAASDHLRTRARQRLRSVPLLDPAELGEAAPAEEDDEARRCLSSVLRPFIAALPPRYRAIIELTEIDGLPHAVVAARLGLSVSGVKSRVQRGRERLREMLERCCAIAVDARGTPVSCERRSGGRLPDGCCGNGGTGTAALQAVPSEPA